MVSNRQIYARPYLESSVFIGLIKGEVISGIERGQIAQLILDDAATGRWPIFTATFTLAEVIKDKGRPMLTPGEEQRIDAFFRHDYIKLVTLDRRVAEHARMLARRYGLGSAVID